MVTNYGGLHRDPRAASRYLSEYEAGYFARQFVEIERPLVRKVLGDLRLERSSKVVDVACGGGRILDILESYVDAPLGVDISSAMLASSAHIGRPEGRLMVADVAQLPFPTDFGRVDLITAFRLYLNQTEAERMAFLQSAQATLRPGGFLLFNVHVAASSPLGVAYRLLGASPLTRSSLKRRVRNFASIEAVRRDLKTAGLIPIDVWRYGGLPRVGAASNKLSPRAHHIAERASATRLMEVLRQNILMLAMAPV